MIRGYDIENTSLPEVETHAGDLLDVLHKRALDSQHSVHKL
jgi:hypothetical protein